MAYPDPGPLTPKQLDQLEVICKGAENDGHLTKKELRLLGADDPSDSDICTIWIVIGYYDRHGRKLLEAARWALAHGWQRGTPPLHG